MRHPDRYEFKRGGGIITALGIPLLLACFFFLYLAFKGTMITESGDPLNPWIVVAAVAPFMVISLAMVLGRAGVNVDRRRGVVVSWWGLMVPMRSTNERLADFHHISLRRKVLRRRKTDAPTIVFPIELIRDGGEIECQSLPDYTEARRKAEEFSKFAGLDLHDSTGAGTIAETPTQLDEPVADRAKRLQRGDEWPELPAGSAIAHEAVGENVVIRLPSPGVRWAHLLFLLPVLALLGFGVYSFVTAFSGLIDQMPPLLRFFFYGFVLFCILIPVAATLLPAVRGAVKRETVAASWRGVRVERKGLLGTKKWTFPADRIEELSLARPRIENVAGGVKPVVTTFFNRGNWESGSFQTRGLRLRSDEQHCVIGASLTDSELDWLEKALTYILVHRP